MLYIVPTPVGNLGDITLRAIDVLKSVSLILAEDTRTTSHLLKKYEINTPLKAYHAYNEHKSAVAYTGIALSGKDIALVSDAGTPGISDPGFLLIRTMMAEGIEVTCLPGATAFVPALVMSGLASDKFFFEGFLPHKKGRLTRLKYLSSLPCTFIVYESPFRLEKCIRELSEYCSGERTAAIIREISKIHEEVVKGTLSVLLEKISTGQITAKGEIVIIVDGTRL